MNLQKLIQRCEFRLNYCKIGDLPESCGGVSQQGTDPENLLSHPLGFYGSKFWIGIGTGRGDRSESKTPKEGVWQRTK